MRFFPQLIFILLASAMLIYSCSSKKEATKKGALTKDAKLKNFYRTDNLGNVLDLAEKENKLVYVDIYTDWCLPCKIMNESVYSDRETIDYLKENFICYKVDGEKINGPDLVALFQVKNYPGILMLNQRGGVIEKNLGGMTKNELMAMGDRAISFSLTQTLPNLLDHTCTDMSQ